MKSFATVWLVTVAAIAFGAVIVRAVLRIALSPGFRDFAIRIHATKLSLGLATGAVAWVVLKIVNLQDRAR
jgi:hypothetical protein